MEKQKRTFSPEFKIKAVELCIHRGNLQSVAAELDVSAKNLSRWKQEKSYADIPGSASRNGRFTSNHALYSTADPLIQRTLFKSLFLLSKQYKRKFYNYANRFQQAQKFFP